MPPPFSPHGRSASRALLSRRTGEAVLLGEVNLPHKDQLRYFGGDDADGQPHLILPREIHRPV